ncbi:MAG: alpha/beta hydrolase [Candidatus Bathyarchaeia archaeon]
MTPIFIHGAGASPMVWRLQLLHFKGSLAVQLPGHPTGSGYSTIEDYAASVEEYIRKEAVKEPVLIGHSMGGGIAITLALANFKLAGLVLVGTGARLRVHPALLSKVNENYEEASKLIATWSVSPSSDPVIAERIAQELLRMNSQVTYGDFMACDKFDRMNDVQKITCKTLIVVGEDDRMTPVKYSQYLHQKISGSKLVVIPGAGHSVMLEKHRMFNDAVGAFLDSL